MENIYNAIQNVYNMDKTTWQEVLAELYNLVYKVENKFDLFENKFGQLLGEEVTRELKKMYDDGSLASLINDDLLKEYINKDIKTKVDAFKTEFSEQLDNCAKKDDVAKISSGTPAFANSTTEMTDNTKNYVNTTDGYLYIYNGDSWVKTNVLYQSTGITVNSVTYRKLEEELKSLVVPYYSDSITPTWIDGYVIDYNGTVTATPSYKYAKYPVKGNEAYKIKAKRLWSNCAWLIMDSNNKVLFTNTKVSDNATIEEIIEIPSNGAYLCFNNWSNSFSYLVKEKYKLKENVKSALDNKTIIFTGDSICQAVIDGVTPQNQYGWCEIIKENNPTCIMKNYGIGGTTIAKISGKNNSIIERLNTMYSSYPNADYIIIEGGVNDCYSENIQLGEITEGYNATFDEYTFCGALESLFKNAILKWKGKKIGYIVTFKVPSADYNNFKEYMNKAKQICEKWSIPYVDLYNNSGLEYHISEIATAYSYGGGGLHPNIEGYKIITPKIESWIKTL